jgi:hypothetical protein
MRFEAGTNLYRAGNLKSPSFFTLKPENAKEYGSVGHYKLMRNVNLLNMSKPDVIRNLLKNAKNNETKRSLQKAFRINNNNKVFRFSKVKYNVPVAQLIGTLGFNGYYGPRMRTKYHTGYFHEEVALRDPTAVEFIGMTNFLASPEPVRKRTRRLGN